MERLIRIDRWVLVVGAHWVFEVCLQRTDKELGQRVVERVSIGFSSPRLKRTLVW